MPLHQGFLQLGGGISVGLCGLAAGFAIGIVGDAGGELSPAPFPSLARAELASHSCTYRKANGDLRFLSNSEGQHAAAAPLRRHGADFDLRRGPGAVRRHCLHPDADQVPAEPHDVPILRETFLLRSDETVSREGLGPGVQ